MTTALQEATRRRAGRDVLVQVVARAANLALGIVVTALVVRTLGEAGYGEWSTILATLSMLGYLTTFGLQDVAVRQAAGDPEHEPDWLGALIVVYAALSLPVIAIGVVVLIAVHESQEMLVAGMILLATFPVTLVAPLAVAFRLRLRNGIAMAILTFNSVFWGAAVVAIHALGGGLVALAIAMSATSALSSILTLTAALRLTRVHLRPSREAVVRLVRVGTPVGLSGLLVLAYARIDQVLVFEIAGSREAGLYGAVYRLLESAHFIPGSLLTTLAPLMAAAWPRDPERLLRLARASVEYLAMGSLGFLVFAALTAEPVVRFLFGPEFAPAAPALPVLGAAFVVISFGYLTDNLILVLGRQRRLIPIAFGGLVLNVAANLALIPRYGFMGAAWATLATELFVELLGIVVVMRALGLRRLRVGRIGRIVTAAALFAAYLGTLRLVGAPLGVLVAAALLVYPGLLFALRALDVDEVRSVLLTRAPAAT